MIVFATNNAHKLQEIRQILGDGAKVMSLEDIGCRDDIPETADTLEGNAEIKARWVAEKYGADMVFADDTGLEVAALGGAPGVYSARYAGPGHDSAANMARLLREMDGVADRSARFRTVIALVRGAELTLVEGVVNGTIATEPHGTDGFGYDPVFVPEGHSVTFAQMSADEKNAISHRGRAMARLLEVLSIK
ncbi:MAG: RdgB/HAM1 family non-canonical purine NTP pyrophosphatase [Muribaculaceae bacterium]|nr:RdgB/HAM1 family non-canonical purine NTP pyrophosphatase [Muribaculaceae bacterium]MDE6509295.1 RdgB/HAM1 family non-canonical purine NTP pyrophosphatase [Muribaculaceae bacterium]